MNDGSVPSHLAVGYCRRKSHQVAGDPLGALRLDRMTRLRVDKQPGAGDRDRQRLHLLAQKNPVPLPPDQ